MSIERITNVEKRCNEEEVRKRLALGVGGGRLGVGKHLNFKLFLRPDHPGLCAIVSNLAYAGLFESSIVGITICQASSAKTNIG